VTLSFYSLDRKHVSVINYYFYFDAASPPPIKVIRVDGGILGRGVGNEKEKGDAARF
jgi:hypothetical protein